MNRSRVIHRDFEGEGGPDAQRLGIALAQIADPGLLEALVHHVSALREFGGELYIGAARTRVDGDGTPFVTHAYVTGYTEKSRIKSNTVEADEQFEAAEVEAPEFEEYEPAAETLSDEIEAEAVEG